MNTQQLYCFIAAADKLNFTKAAEDLQLTPPTVTHHIRKLEEELGVILFIRNPKYVKLTEKGELFYAYAKEIVEKEILAKRQMQEMSNPDLDFISIGCTSITELELIKRALAVFRSEYPTTYPKIIINNYFQISTSFGNSQIDLFFATKEMVSNNPDCTFRRLYQANDYALIPSTSSLYGKDEVSFSDMEDEILITLSQKLIPHGIEGNVQNVLKRHADKHFDIICETESEGILLAESGYGITILPGYMLPEHLKNVHVAKIKDADILDYGIAYNPKTATFKMRKLIQTVRAAVSSL